MSSTIFPQSVSQRRAAWLALFAILLIVVAPLISISLQKDPMSAMPGMHHAMSMDMSHDMSPEITRHDMAMTHGMPIDHAEACGYCVLLAHVPGLIFALALFFAMVLRRIRLPVSRPVLKHWHYFPWLYPETRAPPRWSAFSL